MKGEIAIVTLYDNVNFGNKLQNYAVQRYFELIGFDTKTLPCSQQLLPKHNVVVFIKLIIHRFIQALGFEKEKKQYVEALKRRRDNIKIFSDEYLKTGEDCGYTNVNRKVKAAFYVTGSDQVWHYNKRDKRVIEYFLLTFAEPNQRMTIAPSFGFDNLPHKYLKIYKKGLEGFEYLSVREERGAELIKELTGKDATVLLDPTMLIDTSEWLKILRKPSQYTDDNYIFVYILGGFKGEVQEKTCKLGEDLDLQVIDIMDINSDYYIHTRPDEFLYWIHNAQLVVTDSFHASVFSIIFNRPFVVSERVDIKGMGSRLDTLFNKFGITGRHFRDLEDGFENPGEVRDRLFVVDYSSVPEILDSERKKAAEFYKRCFHEE